MVSWILSWIRFQFGEVVDGYETKVLNEREARAAAGIMLLWALFAFFSAFFLRDFVPLQIFVTIFMVDFVVRVLINPNYAPTMLLGKLATSHQKVEYTGAPQKRFAWSLGMIIAIIMFISVVVLWSLSWFNLVLCGMCLVFLFFESAFGICLGCVMYAKLTPYIPQYCPGGVCEMFIQQPVQKMTSSRRTLLVFWLVLIAALVIYNPFVGW